MPRLYGKPVEADMLRFIVVNDRTPRPATHCALCCTAVTGRYVREISTKFCYCSRDCFAQHTKLEQLVIEYRVRVAS